MENQKTCAHCRAMRKDHDSRQGRLNGMQQVQELEGVVYSPVVYSPFITDFQSIISSAKATNPGEQQLGGPNEESQHGSAISNNTNTTAKSVRKAPKRMRRLYHEFQCSSFPISITKRLSSSSLGQQAASHRE